MNTTPITPFRIETDARDIDDLRRRLAETRWPEPLPPAPAWGSDEVGDAASDWSRGAAHETLQTLVEAWRDEFDWPAYVDRLNELPHFITEVEGQRIHFVHMRSSNPDATPLILTHGWPGSFLEFVHLIGPLTEPQQHGGDAADAFHVVIPSIPGFAFSSPLADGGWDDTRIARAFAEIMGRLGYERFVAQGGDAGAGISPEIARVAPDRVIAVHVNGTTGPSVEVPVSADELASMTERERRAVADIEAFMWTQFGYISIQSTRPGLVGTMLTDSPVAQLAWILDKFQAWTWPVERDVLEIVNRDLLLANVSLYWFTRTAGSSALTVYAQTSGWGTPKERTDVPLAVLNLAHDIAIRRYVEQEHTVARWTDVERGGHFAALEEPELLVDDLRAFVRDVRGA